MIIAGDLNIDILKTNKITAELVHSLASYNLRLQFDTPTRLISGTCLDNIAHNVQGCKGKLAELALSDHMAQILKCPVKKSCAIKYWYVQRRDFSNENRDKFVKCLNSLSFSEVYETDDPNIAFSQFHNTFTLFYDLCFPYIKVKIMVDKRPKWVSKGISLCSKRRRELLWKYRKSPTNVNKCNFKLYSKRYKSVLNLTQKSQNSYYIKTSINKSKATWQIINKNKSNILKENINKIKNDDGNTVSNPKEMVQLFNDFFSNVANCERTNTIPHFTGKSQLNSIFMKPVNPKDVFNIINSLKNVCSTGYDEVTVRVVKDVAHIISTVLNYTINLSIEHGVFPDKLKYTIIKPMFKKGDVEDLNCYRPIALIPIFSKIYEKVIYASLYSFLEINNVFANEQYGFRKGQSINDAIYNFIHTVIKKLDNSKPAVAIYLDMSKAFDHVRHDILLQKLNDYGVRGNVNNLIKSYLSNRHQATQINRVCPIAKEEKVYESEFTNVRFGVPQGSVLGPLLFIVYVNDLPSITHHQMTLFADDSTVLFNDDNMHSSINVEIDMFLTNATEWLSSNNLSINLSKTKIMKFRQNFLPSPNLNITFKETNIEEIDEIKFLGLHIDRRLNWKNHIDYVCKRLNQQSYALYKLSKIADRSAVLSAYHGYVSSILRYGIIFWGNSTNKDLAFKAQKRCIRSIVNIDSTESCVPHFRELRVLSLPCLFIYECAIYAKLNIHCFEFRNRARHKDKMTREPHKTALFHKSVFYLIPEIYNKLPKKIRDLDFHKYKKHLFQLLVDKCYYSLKDYLDDVI